MARRERSLVREESQLDDMRAAIRGDFERLKERRGDQELMVASDDVPPAPDETEPAPEPPVHEDPPALEPVAGAEADAPEPPGEVVPEFPVAAEPDGDRRRSWLERVLGRS